MIENIPALNETSQRGFDLITLLKDAVPYAAYLGAIGAGANALFSYLQYTKNKPIINVEFGEIFEYSKERDTFEVYISCTNMGDSAVTISSFGFYISELDKYITVGPQSFDRYFRRGGGCTRLDPGCNMAAHVETKGIEKSLLSESLSLNSKLFFFFRDGHEKAYICQTPFYVPKPHDRETIALM
ncbi:MAG: hypothetical protein PHS80_12220 [Methanothrix sp.]|nr:hypothetical protein [Methanothrix sp.]MDD4448307.1 hypothetical protein [Methanothrix sp.]